MTKECSICHDTLWIFRGVENQSDVRPEWLHVEFWQEIAYKKVWRNFLFGAYFNKWRWLKTFEEYNIEPIWYTTITNLSPITCKITYYHHRLRLSCLHQICLHVVYMFVPTTVSGTLLRVTWQNNKTQMISKLFKFVMKKKDFTLRK